MRADFHLRQKACNCLAIRQAARHVTQLYDLFLAPVGLRTTQYSILAVLQAVGPMTITALAEIMVMDRTTLGRNILPLQRRDFVAVERGRADRRSKEIRLTDVGTIQLDSARGRWAQAQARFETMFGGERAGELRTLLEAIVATDFSAGAPIA
jgi:DNA-binding MarR family transcriptional regulator